MPLTRRTLLASAAATGAVAAAAGAPIAREMLSSGADLSGRSILITGTSSGFGRLMAESFARAGATVFATMRNLPRPEGEALRALADDEGLALHVVEIDVTDDAQVAAGVAEAERIAGRALDVVVNNAGIAVSGPVEVQDMAATKLMFDTNVFGPHRLARAALPAMRAAGSGLIVNVSSQLGRVIVPYSGQYSPTKFALEAMSEAMAYELVPHGIEVTIIQPGGYPTEIWRNRNRLSSALKARAEEEHLAGYPQAVAQMGEADGSGREADPMDVPNAIARIVAMPSGTRPLRRAVHPGDKPQLPINAVSAEVQQGWLGESGFAPLIAAVHD